MAIIFGTNGVDTKNGTADPDTIYGYPDGGNPNLDGGGDTLNGLGGDDALYGGGGADILIGGTGADALYGGIATDTASYASATGSIRVRLLDPSTNKGEAAGDTYDSIENLWGSAFNDQMTGDDGANSLVGNGGDDVLLGAGGNDELFGGAGDDTLTGGVGADLLDGGDGIDTVNYYPSSKKGVTVNLATGTVSGGNAEGDTLKNVENVIGTFWADTLTGTDGDNVLSGGSGADTLIGLGGDDLYWISDSTAIVVEEAGGGHDIVMTSIHYVLKAGIEVEVLRTDANAGTQNIDLTGNEFAQLIVGNNGSNSLTDGGGAADTLVGFAGNDTYYINHSDTVIIDAADNVVDVDTVVTSASYVLKAGVEIEVLRTNHNGGIAPLNLSGNEFRQTIIGNAGDNILYDGGGGADQLRGGAGNDYYRVSTSLATVLEVAGAGNDTLATLVDYTLQGGVEIELLRTFANVGTDSIDLTGNEFAQGVRGNAGSNVIDGKGGSDTLQGLTGQDFFVFSTALGPDNVDIVADFSAVDDTIWLENAVFDRLTAEGVLNPAYFRANSAGIAGDGNDVILYNTTNGQLFYDADGNRPGARIHFATLTGAPAITAADFIVI